MKTANYKLSKVLRYLRQQVKHENDGMSSKTMNLLETIHLINELKTS